MVPFRYTLLADGTSDRCLIRIIDWILEKHPIGQQRSIRGLFADPRLLHEPEKRLPARILQAVAEFPCDVLFVHRDAEGVPADERISEIKAAAAEAKLSAHIPVVPVRMTEAWLLLDERAIRMAAGNPNGTVPLPIPSRHAEELLDPKRVLNECLVAASEKSGRRKARFKRDISLRRQRVAAFVDDFSPLRGLSAFTRFERDTKQAIEDVIEA